METLSERITQYLLCKKMIVQDQVEWCHYMVIHRVMDVASLVLLIPIGAAVVGWWNALVFTFGLRFLRSRTGGFHARTPIGCLVSSVAAQIIFLSFVPSLNNINLLLLVGALSIISILLLAPANNAHLHFSPEELRALKPRILLRMVVVVVLGCVCLQLDISLFACSVLSIVATAFLLALAQMGYGVS